MMGDWARRARCGRAAADVPAAADVSLRVWTGCVPGADVQLYVADGAGHTYPGGPVWPEYVESVLGTVDSVGGQATSIDAASLMLDFFDQHRRVR